jgi:outer membrane immunogenic protein
MAMKKFLLTTTAAVCLAAGSAGAADLARPVYKAAPAPAPACAQFGGFYVGGNVGGAYYDHTWSDRDAWAQNIADNSFLPNSVQSSKSGFIGGVEGGYNWQTHCTLFGIEADYSWASISNETFSTSFPGNNASTLTESSKLRGFGTVRTRAGVIVDNLLIYVTGGLAYANFERSATASDGFLVTETLASTKTKWGWTFGVGTEWAMWDNWSLKSEVLYARFEKDQETFLSPFFAANFRFDHQDSVWVSRIGLNYRFGGYGPVVAKY